MNIGEAATHTGLPAKTIRYYEDIGLVTADRRDNGYRSYDTSHIHKLRFLGRSRSLGFSVEECRQLLSLYEDQNRSSASVKALALHKLEEIDKKIADLQGLRETLSNLAQTCHGDDKPDCPILDGLSAEGDLSAPEIKRVSETL